MSPLKPLSTRLTSVTFESPMIDMDQPDGSTEPRKYGGIIQAALAIIAIGLLLLGCVLVLLPFFSAILWGILLCFSTWGIYCELRRVLGGRSSLAALTMTLLLASVAVAPFIIVGSSLANNVADMIQVIRHFVEAGPPAPPQWVVDIPLIGPHVHDYLTHLAGDQAAQRIELHSMISPLKAVALELGKALGHGIFEISLSLLVCFFLYRDGDAAAARLETAADRIGGAQGRALLKIARLTLTGVVYGILGTSLIQGVCAGVGFWIAGIPGAFLLGFATFVLSFVPLGPALLWVPAAGWLYEQGFGGWATFIVVWSLLSNTLVEQALKPIIISHTGGTPFLVVLFGVLGGALAFGFIGVFIGPALLAVGYALIDEWSSRLAAQR
jgi:predicted PurR-regulated permease PerM